MRFWGVTGTNGKTTTTWIFAEFLNHSTFDSNPNTQTPSNPNTRKCGYVTTVEVYDGKDRYYTGYTTPPLKQLKEIFAKMEANGCTDCVMEVSSHAIHQHRTGDTVFAGGVFTNLSEDHLDYHKTMEAYFDVKLDFARQIAASHPTTPDMGRRDLPPYAVCLDGGYGREMFYAVGNLSVNVIPVSVSTSTYDLDRLQLVGDYNKSNVLCAAALAEAAGVPHETIQAVIPTLKPRWGRLEYVECGSKAKVYVDFAHTPDGLEKVLTAVRGIMNSPSTSRHDLDLISRPNLWVVFGAGGDRDPMKRPLMGAACAKLADRLVVTSDNPRSEDPLKIIDAILEGVRSSDPNTQTPSNPNTQTPKHPNTLHVEPDRKLAIEYALRNAAEGDVVVIAGKGHETTQEIKGVKYPFDDREVVRSFT